MDEKSPSASMPMKPVGRGSIHIRAELYNAGAQRVVRIKPAQGKDWNESLVLGVGSGSAFEQLEELPRQPLDDLDALRPGLMRGDKIFAPLEVAKTIAGFRQGSVNVVAGYGDSCKSWLAIDLMLARALGDPWLGFPTEKGKTLFLDWENGSYELRRRLQKLRQGRGAAVDSDSVAIECMSQLSMTSEAFWPLLERYALEFDVIVIDSLKAAASGIDENDSRIREPIDRLRGVAERFRTTFILIAHSKKRANDGDRREALRGSSAIFDAFDTAYCVTRTLPDQSLEIRQIKARHGRAIEDIAFRLDDLPDGGARLVALERDEIDDEDGKNDAKRTKPSPVAKKKNQILAALRDEEQGAGLATIRKAVGGNKRIVNQAIEQLLADGKIENRGTDAKHAYYVTDSADGGEVGDVVSPAASGSLPVPDPVAPLGGGETVGMGTMDKGSAASPRVSGLRMPMPITPSGVQVERGTGIEHDGTDPDPPGASVPMPMPILPPRGEDERGTGITELSESSTAGAVTRGDS